MEAGDRPPDWATFGAWTSAPRACILAAERREPPTPLHAQRARERPIFTERHLIGSSAIGLGLAVTVYGYRLGRRYGASISHTGIGRSRPPRHSALAFLGNVLVIAGLIGVMMAVMLGFF